MSAQIEKAGMKGVRILTAMLFVALMLFNIQLAFDDGSASDISLLGLKLSVFVPTAVATSPGQQCVSNCGYSDCCNQCLVGLWEWKLYYDYTSSGCGSCPNWC